TVARVGWFATVAASVVLIASVAAMIFKNRPPGASHNAGTGGNAQLLVQGPTVESSTGAAVAEVQIGAPSNTSNADAGWQSYEALINRPARVIIGSADNSGQDT